MPLVVDNPVVRVLFFCIVAGALAAGCGGGGGDGSGNNGGGGNTNVAPSANAGDDQTVAEQSTVQLIGSATDSNAGDTLSYAWTQSSGTPVSLINADRAAASFVAPEVGPGETVVLVFRLTVTDNGGLSATDTVRITTIAASDSVVISGKADYEFVPPNPNCIGLNYTMTETRPIRGATIQVLNATTDTVIDSDVTDDGGTYFLTVDADTDVYLRVRAELKRIGQPAWDVEVRDNTSNTSVPLGNRPIYVLENATFNAGTVDQTRDLTATTGWGGSDYSEPRAAAPFAVLDAIYTGMQLIVSADPAARFLPLDAFWSVNNRQASGDTNFETGEVGTFYRTDIDSLFLLGQANDDTDEFDSHVIVHEWGHYFEDVFSRSDSIGGAHGRGDKLDMRVAFSEGLATALSGIALQDAIYCDTLGPAQANGFSIDIESDSSNPRGWFNEFSLLALIYDLWDDTVELNAGDSGSVPFTSIYNTMIERQRNSAAYTSAFTFLQGLVDEDASSLALVNDLRAHHDINGTGIYGDGETNDAGSAEPDDVLPVYTDISPDGTVVKVCSNRQHDNGNVNGNRLSEYRFLRMTIAVPARYEFDIVTDAATLAQLPPGDPDNQSDPNIFFRLNGQIQNVIVGGEAQGRSTEPNRENFTTPNILQPGDYVMDLVEFRHTDMNTNRNVFPARSCFDVSISPSA